jgi:DNA (cytosine-5)-methyltransferase 1
VSSRPRLLDLFCGGGGAAKGYYRAGFDVVGVDAKDQPRYPFPFHQGDALAVLKHLLNGRAISAEDRHYTLDDFAAIHASPPCQHYANVTAWRGNQDDHPDLIAPVRDLLEQTELPYVIENVRTSELRADFMLCGTGFGQPFRRHRFFETNWSGLVLSHPCQHRPSDYSFDHGGKQPESVYRDAMGCGWMTVEESREAIPPIYTGFIGAQLMAHIEEVRRVAA